MTITHHEQVREAQERLRADLDQFAVISGMGRFELTATVERMALKAHEHRKELEPVYHTAHKRKPVAVTG